MKTVITALELELGVVPDGYKIVYSGVGKINAAIAAMDAIHAGATEIINYGTAGVVGKKPIVGTLVEVDTILQRDINAEPLAPRGITPYEDHLHTAAAILLETGTDITLGTGDSFVTEKDEWFDYSSVDIVDMEAYSIAKVCKRKNIPFRCYKWVSDFADENASRDWQVNIAKGANAIRKVLSV